MAIVAIGCALLFYACNKAQNDTGSNEKESMLSSVTTSTLVSSETYYTKITQSEQARIKVNLMSDNTYDVYVTREPATDIHVTSHFPGLTGSYNDAEDEVLVNHPAGSYTYISGLDPGNPIDCSTPIGGTWVYTCTCCGNKSGEGCKVNFNWSPFYAFCKVSGNICPKQDGDAVQCGMTATGGITTGGVMLATAKANIRIHQ